MHAPEKGKIGRTPGGAGTPQDFLFRVPAGLFAAVCGPGCLAPFATMGEMASHQPLLLRFKSPSRTIAARLGSCLTCVFLLAGTVHALDPNKRLTQYMHTSWRIQDGSAPSGMYTIAQTSDGFLWFLSSRGEIYRFDGVQFRPWRKPADAGHHRIGRSRREQTGT